MSEPEAEPEKQTKSRGGCGCLGLLMLLVGYILSPVPIILVFERFPEPMQEMIEPVLESLFFPLGWCYENSSIVQSFYDWYLGKFVMP